MAKCECKSLQDLIVTAINRWNKGEISDVWLGQYLTGLHFDERAEGEHFKKHHPDLNHLLEDVGPDLEFQAPSEKDRDELLAALNSRLR